MSQGDHDILIRVDENLKNLLVKVSEHMEDDDLKFKAQDKQIEFHSKIVYCGMGAWFVISLLIVLFKN